MGNQNLRNFHQNDQSSRPQLESLDYGTHWYFCPLLCRRPCCWYLGKRCPCTRPCPRYLDYAGGHVSGANYNPAVSLGLAITGHLPFCDMGFYFLFQFIGAFLAGILTSWYQGGPGCPPGWQSTVFQGYSFCGAIMEMNATFFLVLTVFGTAIDKRAAPGVYGLCIGGSLTMSILGIGRKTGAALNPWRFFGPAVAGLLFRAPFPSTWWMYLFPFLGGVGAACLYHFCFYEKPEPEAAEVELVDAEIKI